MNNNINVDNSWTTYVKGATGVIVPDNPPDDSDNGHNGNDSNGDSDSDDSENDSNGGGNAPDNQCTTSNWPNVEEECGPCKVLAGRMRRRSCAEYCAGVG